MFGSFWADVTFGPFVCFSTAAIESAAGVEDAIMAPIISPTFKSAIATVAVADVESFGTLTVATCLAGDWCA